MANRVYNIWKIEDEQNYNITIPCEWVDVRDGLYIFKKFTPMYGDTIIGSYPSDKYAILLVSEN